MSHRDARDRKESSRSGQDLSLAIGWLLAGIFWKQHRFLRKDCRWSLRALITGALFWAWSAESGLLERFDQAREMARRVCGRGAPAKVSYQAFLELLVRWKGELTSLVRDQFRAKMDQTFPGQGCIRGFPTRFADGTHNGVARTRSNEARFSPRKSRKRGRSGKPKRPASKAARQARAKAKKADSPQISLTMLLCFGLELPWDWAIGPSDESERDQLLRMVPSLPPDALVVADAGFVGYEFWRDLQQGGRNFLIRVGGNVRLLKQLGCVREREGIVYLWPDSVAKKKKEPPLELRLVTFQGERHAWHLVTSVLDAERLSDRDVIDIYRQRWGIELFFRHFKQTFGRGKLRSRKAEHAQCELEWSLLGLWGMMMYAKAQLPTSPPENKPPRLSVAKMLRAFDRALLDRPGRESLAQRLKKAVIDSYARKDKSSRGYPRKKYEPPTKPPKVVVANDKQRELAKAIEEIFNARGLTA